MLKRQFRAILCFALLAMATPSLGQDQIFTSVTEFQQTTLGAQTYTTADSAMKAASLQITVIGADDLEVVGTVLGIASSLKSLFDADHSGEILKKLNDLREQNAKIIDLLSKVISVLENMDVVLKGVTRDAFVFDLRAEISSAMVQYYETRSGLISDPTYKQRAMEQFKTQYETLSRLSRKMMQYGFGGYNTVGTTMFFEIDLAHRLQPRTEQLNALYTYRDYFRNARDPAIENSVGATAKYLADVVAAADGILAAADKSLAAQRRFPRGEYCGQNECECGFRRTCYQTYTIINGDRNSGYSTSPYRDSYRTEGRCTRCPIDRGPAVTVGEKLSLVLPQTARDLPPSPVLPPAMRHRSLDPIRGTTRGRFSRRLGRNLMRLRRRSTL